MMAAANRNLSQSLTLCITRSTERQETEEDKHLAAKGLLAFHTRKHNN